MTERSTASMPRIFPWCLMHPKNTLLSESEVDCTEYWHCSGCSKLWRWYNVVHGGSSWYILVHPIRRGMKQKAATGAELRASSPTSPTTGAMPSHARELLNLLKASFASAYSKIFQAASRTNMNQCLHGCLVLLTFATSLCICPSIFAVSVETRNTLSILWFCQLALLLRNAGRNQFVQAPQLTQGLGQAHSILFSMLCRYAILSNHSLI